MGQVIFGLAGLCLMALLLVICISGWTWALRRLMQGEPILRQEAGETISWGLIDIVAAVVIGFTLIATFQGIAVVLTGVTSPIDDNSMTAVQQAGVIFALSAGELLTMLAIFGFILVRGYGLQMFGQRGEKFYDDLLLGIVAFGMLVVPTLILQAILAYFKPYEHPLIDMLIRDKSVPMAIASVMAAVIAAPLFEEFFFRGLFQGWLQDTVDGRLEVSNVFLGRVRWLSEANATPAERFAAEVDSPGVEEPQEEIIAAVAATDEGENPFHSPTTAAAVPSTKYEPPEALRERTVVQICGPILVSAAFFALMHLGQGFAPVPLFFLALGLGYLYQRTRRLTPCVIVHFLLNGQSMTMLLIQVFVIGDDSALIAK